jgi:hypothetical protein
MAKITSKSGAVIELDSLKDFLIKLTEFQKAILSYEEQINSSINVVSRDWQDQKFEEYRKDFGKYVKVLKDLSAELNTHKNYMTKEWIPLIEEYKKNNR